VNILLCPLSDGGYLYPAVAVGLELRRRGHVVSALARASASSVLDEAGIACQAAEGLGGERGFSVVRWARSGLAQYRATLRAAVTAQADLLVTSVLCHGALLAAEALDIPVAVIGLASHIWDYRAGGEAEPQEGRTRANRTSETLALYAAQREQVGLRSCHPRDPLLGEALLLRGTPGFEYPGALLPDRVHHVGPLPWEPAAPDGELAGIASHLNGVGKPVVYVHLGRFFGGADQWPALNEAFTAAPLQAVVERGRSGSPRPGPEADILLVHKRWMGPLVDRAGLVLTSGTSAPVLAALRRGRPLAVAPNGSEQPVLAAATTRLGVAARVPDGPAAALRATLAAAWGNAGLLRSAADVRDELAAAGGARRAADMIERAATGGTLRLTQAAPLREPVA
jgi:UDP:flavonoid glycosyltransferase YjiC (YdhE family)